MNEIKNKKFIYLYKIFSWNNTYQQLTGPYHVFNFNQGLNKDPYSISKEKLNNNDKVNNCFHCFKSFEDAKRYYLSPIIFYHSMIILKIKVNPKNIICTGIQNDWLKSINVGVSAFTLTKSEYKKFLSLYHSTVTSKYPQ